MRSSSPRDARPGRPPKSRCLLAVLVAIAIAAVGCDVGIEAVDQTSGVPAEAPGDTTKVVSAGETGEGGETRGDGVAASDEAQPAPGESTEPTRSGEAEASTEETAGAQIPTAQTAAAQTANAKTPNAQIPKAQLPVAEAPTGDTPVSGPGGRRVDVAPPVIQEGTAAADAPLESTAGPLLTLPAPSPAPTNPTTPTPEPTTPTPNPTPPTPPPPGGNADRVLTSADSRELVNGFTVPAGQTWEFASNQNVSIDVGGNVVVHGVLRMRPSSADIVHQLRFVGINERDYVGGGMQVLESDVGLWVMHSGQLDVEGHRRSGWTSVAGSANRGSTQLTVNPAPTGWRIGDEISIAPTAPPDAERHYEQFDERRIVAINGATITVDRALTYDHPQVNGSWTAEVMNLTRNVRISGMGANVPDPIRNGGRAHIMIHSTKPQHIRYAELRNLGPRTSDTGSELDTDGVTGRYALHFHHNGDGSRGSRVEGVVVREAGNHGLVPHASNGITMFDNVVYDGWQEGVWWDPPGTGVEGYNFNDLSNDSDDVMLDHILVAIVRADPDFRGYVVSGFHLSTGRDVTVRNSVAVGIQGNDNASGFHWPATANRHPNNVWNFSGNVSHNNRADGLFVWQNDENRHVTQNFTAYHNGDAGIEHGAYLNAYQYNNISLFSNGNNAIVQHGGVWSTSNLGRTDGYSQAFEGIDSNGPLLLTPLVLGSGDPTLYRNCSFTEVEIDNASSRDNPGLYDFVNCGLSPSDFKLTSVEPGTRIRVQDGGSAYSLDSQGQRQSISPFYSR